MNKLFIYKLQLPYEKTNGLAVKPTLNHRHRNADLPSSQQRHPSERRPLLPETPVFREFISHQSGLRRPAPPMLCHLLTKHRQRQRKPLAVIRRCREDVWLCMCGSVCVVLIIIICPRCSPFSNVKNIFCYYYYYFSGFPNREMIPNQGVSTDSVKEQHHM